MDANRFSGIKEQFYSSFDDPAVFDCAEFNLLKVVQHGARRIRSLRAYTYIFLPFFLQDLVLFLFRLRMKLSKQITWSTEKELSRFRGRKFLFLDQGTEVNDGSMHPVSFFYHHLLSAIGKENAVLGLTHQVKTKIGYDLDYHTFYESVYARPLTAEDKKMISDLRKTFRKIKWKTRFSPDQLHKVKAAFELFWRHYRVWNEIIRTLQPEKCTLFPHYQQEHIILALRRNGVQVIELQHGLIAPEDFFYVYPEKINSIRQRALFADRILVYGQFWKDRLLKGNEYPASAISVIGYYHPENKMNDDDFTAFIQQHVPVGKRIILLTVQKFLEKQFVEYATWLAEDIRKKNMDYFILVKPHPRPNEDITSLNEIPGVRVVSYNLEYLLTIAEIHVSVFSTTLYDAVRFRVKNFALHIEEYGDYVKTVVSSGVASLLHKNENPIEKIHERKENFDAGYFYAKPDYFILDK